MGFYNVVAPCVVGHLHHVRPTTQPIEVDDAEAGPLVESGCLTPYEPGDIPVKPFQADVTGVEGDTGTIIDGVVRVSEPEFDDEPPTDPPPPRARGGRRKG